MLVPLEEAEGRAARTLRYHLSAGEPSWSRESGLENGRSCGFVKLGGWDLRWKEFVKNQTN